ncbi:hypothetical protein FOZ60_001297, partial [Perkinsus olseni]
MAHESEATKDEVQQAILEALREEHSDDLTSLDSQDPAVKEEMEDARAEFMEQHIYTYLEDGE